MTYWAANMTGLIELDTGLAVSFGGEGSESDLKDSLARLTRLDQVEDGARMYRTHTGPRFATQFLAADIDQLQGELNLAFAQLLQRLFEGD